MNLFDAKSITIRGKSVKQIDINGKTAWKAAQSLMTGEYRESENNSGDTQDPQTALEST